MRLLLVCLFFALAGTAQAQELDWADVSEGGAEGTAIATDDHGYIYSGGDLSGSAIFDNGTRSGLLVSGANYVAVHNPDGVVQWVSTILADVGDLMITGIDADSYGNVYITGRINGDATYTFGAGEANETIVTTGGNLEDMFLAKFDAAGLFQWARQAGISEANGANDIAVDAAGNSHVTGFYRSNAVFGDDGNGAVVQLSSVGGVFDADVFITKYDTNGDLLWARSAGGPAGFDNGFGIDLDHTNNVFITGDYLDEATFGQEKPKATETIVSEGGRDGFLARYTHNGAFKWVVSMGGTGFDRGRDLVNHRGKSVVIGRFQDTATFGTTSGATDQRVAQGNENVYIARYDRSGKLLWVTDLFMDAFEGSSVAMDVGYGKFTYCVTANYNGQVTLGFGTPDETTLNSADPNMFFSCYSGQGVFQFAEDDPAVLNAGTVYAGPAILSESEIIVTGGFQGTNTFGPGDPNEVEFTTGPDQELFVAKYTTTRPRIDDFISPSTAAGGDLTLDGAVPSGYVLGENYPNPFNPQTTIRFGLPESAPVSLTVYDVLGQAVAQLVDGELAAGTHEVSFDAGDLPSGIYLYRLVTPAGSQARSMMLVK